MNMKTRLSKSRYTKYCQCPKNMWLAVNEPDLAPIDAALEARFAEGNLIGDLAMGLFGPYVEVTAIKDNKLDLETMIARTAELMADPTCNVICEASFNVENGDRTDYCAVDILRRKLGGWAIYEVKSSTSHIGDEITKPEKFRKYAVDIAYQKYVLESAGVNVTGTYLVTLNSDYVRKGDLDINELFNVLDLSNLVAEEYAKVPGQSKHAHKVLALESAPDRDLGMHCTDPYSCSFWDYCTSQKGLDLKNDNQTVFSLYRMGMAKKLECFNGGIVTFKDALTLKLTKMQQMQVNCSLNGTEYLDPKGIKGFLDKITYPLYFLDFESMMPGLPQYDGTRPYMQVCFQYSLHYIEHEGGELKHVGYLAPSDGKDPRRPLAEALCRDIPEDVCIMAYNDPFEKTRIKEMAEAFPDLAAHLMNIHANIVDLLIPFRSGHYYTPAMGGSFSIKSVLPALFPGYEELDYHNLSTLVQNGGDAMSIFPRMKDMSVEDEREARQALLEYCKLDTLAMVRIWEKLLTIV